MNLEQNRDDLEFEQDEQPEHQDEQNLENGTVKCLAELSMWQDQCKRISAEFENFKRRVDKDKLRWAEVAKESILLELLSFVDTFELALQQKDGVDHTGIEMAFQSLLKLLSKHGVVAIPVSAQFDPEFHEAVMQVPSTDHTSGEIIEVLSKGFMLKDRVLRPAKVSVAV